MSHVRRRLTTVLFRISVVLPNGYTFPVLVLPMRVSHPVLLAGDMAGGWMSDENFNKLLDVSTRIAKAVEAYPPEVRQQAYDDLMRAYRGEQPASGTEPARDEPPAVAGTESSQAGNGAPKKAPAVATKTNSARRPRAKGPEVAALRDYDFWPSGKQTFPQLVETKRPTTLQEKNLLAIYWLEQVAEESAISTAHVLAAFKAAKWKEASDPVNALQVTASVKHWIDTSDMAKLRTARPGRMYVEHEMPVRS
jgi:hypothetical protein